MVEKVTFEDENRVPVVVATRVVKLLKAQHAGFRRKVKGLMYADTYTAQTEAYNQACQDLLDYLDRRTQSRQEE